MDGDIIVRHSLQPLWKTDLTGFALAAVLTGFSHDLQIYNRLKYASGLGYFNAGVLLISLDYWRVHHVAERFANIINARRNDITGHDQDVLNIAFCDKKILLPTKYNLTTSYFSIFHKYETGKLLLTSEALLFSPVSLRI